MKKLFILLVSCTVLLPAYGAVIYESFDYAAGSIIGQSGGGGWRDSWSFPVGVTCTQGTADVVANSLTFSNYATSGGALKLTEDNNQVPPGTRYVGVRRLVDVQTPVGEDLWVSYLAQSDGRLKDFASRTAEIRAGSTPGNTKLRMRPKGSGSQGVYVAYDNVSVNSAASSTQDGTTYLYICRFEDVNTTYSDGNQAPATMWVLNAAGYDAAMTDEILTEDDLNAYYFLKATDAHSNQNLNAGDGIFINLVDANAVDNFAYYFDELRYGTSLDSVLIIPEPATIFLVGIGFACACATVRKRNISKK